MRDKLKPESRVSPQPANRESNASERLRKYARQSSPRPGVINLNATVEEVINDKELAKERIPVLPSCQQ